MAYWWIFGLSYAGACALWLFYMMNKQAAMIRVMMNNGLGESELDAFRREIFSKTLVTLVWSTFFTGSLLGAVVSGIYALAH
jgi:hypothetical protein